MLSGGRCLNKETGEKPVRTRRCKRRVRFTFGSLRNREDRSGCWRSSQKTCPEAGTKSHGGLAKVHIWG